MSAGYGGALLSFFQGNWIYFFASFGKGDNISGSLIALLHTKPLLKGKKFTPKGSELFHFSELFLFSADYFSEGRQYHCKMLPP